MRRMIMRDERGAAFVEFVIVLPFLLFFVFAIIGFGVMTSFRQTMSQAAVEGARRAAVQPFGTSYADRKARAEEAIDEAFAGQIGGALTCASALLDCDIPAVPTTCGNSNQCISVTVRYDYRDHPRVTVPEFLGIAIYPETLEYKASARID